MNAPRDPGVGRLLCLALILTSCAPEQQAPSEPREEPAISNRLDVPPEVVNNLGITFELSTRGRLGEWRQVSGQLEVPESSRWALRAPARVRLVSVVSRWQIVEAGAEIATLTSPELQRAQRTIEFARRTFERTTQEVVAAGARLEESEAHLRDAEAFDAANRKRLEDLQALDAAGQALSSKEVIDAHRTATAAGKARLDAAIARDELIARVATRRLEADQAALSIGERLNALAMLTGRSVQELTVTDERGPAWQAIESLTIRAPAAGAVVELFASQGETLEAGAPIVQVFDTRELRFRGHLPEGDLGALATGSRVRLEFPSRRLSAIETRLNTPLPVADADTRMIHVEADVPNPDGLLAHGISVMAQVLVRESATDEVLIPSRCVVFDGLEAIVFLRDPGDPNAVIRTPVELGARAAGQVEVLAGILDGEEVVADGIHQLEQTGLGKPPQGMHFHADGTWHGEHR